MIGIEGDDALGVAVALGIGLLIGVERERRKGTGPAREPAGIRTFALAALLGAISSIAGGRAGLAVAGLFVATLAVMAYLRSTREDPGITTEVALLVTFFLGALASEEPELASALGVTVAIVLAARTRLHRLARDLMTEEELHDLLLFAAAAVIVLPLLPDEDVGPWDALNPFHTWRLVVLVMAVSSTGYIALRAVGPRFGPALAGLAGGFVSSVATIGSLGATARSRPDVRSAAVAGAVLSTVATVIQMGVVLASTSRPTLREFWPSLVLGGAAAAAFALLILARVPSAPSRSVPPGRAFSLPAAVLFAAMVTAITFLAAGLEHALGKAGVTLSAALGGFANAHAAGASVAALVAAGKLEPSAAVVPILVALTMNTFTKAVAARTVGGLAYARPVWLGLALVLAALSAGALV